jgi:hypothetical protein
LWKRVWIKRVLEGNCWGKRGDWWGLRERDGFGWRREIRETNVAAIVCCVCLNSIHRSVADTVFKGVSYLTVLSLYQNLWTGPAIKPWTGTVSGPSSPQSQNRSAWEPELKPVLNHHILKFNLSNSNHQSINHQSINNIIWRYFSLGNFRVSKWVWAWAFLSLFTDPNNLLKYSI